MGTEKRQEGLEQKVLRFIRDNSLFQRGEKILVAVSGGPDSVSLLYILYHLRSELEIDLQVAHLDHQLRQKESETDARYVGELAEALGLPVIIEKGDVLGYQSEHRLSLEEAAREVRYSFLAETARSLGTNKVAVGHTLNDHVETILLHIIRGAGTLGLQGLLPCRCLKVAGQQLTVVRPLLDIKREETEKYCARLNLSPCVDVSNYSLSPLRNRIRHELLPLLQTYNPEILGALSRMGNVARDELALMEAETQKIWRKITRKQGSALVLNKTGLLKLAPALQRQVLRKSIYKLLGTLRDIESKHIEEILGALQKPAGKRIVLPEGLVFRIEYDRYLLGGDLEELNPFPKFKGEFDIALPGKTQVPGWLIVAKIIQSEVPPGQVIEANNVVLSACFDKDKIGDKIMIRPRKRGDRFQPLGMREAKRLGEFMIDARIPQAWRDRIPILCSPQQIIWVAGWRIDERVRVTESTGRVLCVRMTREAKH